MTKKRCENCKYLIGIVCGLTDGHVDFDWWCDDFEKKDNLTTENRFELRLCNNGTYYLWNNNELTDITFDKFNKESANELIDLLNELAEENEQLKQQLRHLEYRFVEYRNKEMIK